MANACVFCELLGGHDPDGRGGHGWGGDARHGGDDGGAGAHFVFHDDVAAGFLDRRPLFPGHVLVVPVAHVETIVDLPSALVGPFYRRVQAVAAALPVALGAAGTFVATNNVVSQSVPHLHVHVVPRRRGDGLRGFFWPRTTYGSGEASAVAARIAAALEPMDVG